MPSKLKFMIVDTYYPRFLESFYATHPDADSADYEGTLAQVMAECFGTADFYSTNLRALGHEALDVIANDERLQAKWAAEHHRTPSDPPPLQALLLRVPYARRWSPYIDLTLRALLDRVAAEKPDVLYLQDVDLPSAWFMREVKRLVPLVVGQVAAEIDDERGLTGFDLILTSLPHWVSRFRAKGISAEYFRIGFEASVLDKIQPADAEYGVAFVGGFSPIHEAGNTALELLASSVDLNVWGYGYETCDPTSPLLRNFHGEAWGLSMYSILAASKITINRHSAIADGYANNMRLFEATGVGSLLITDAKSNLGELFEVGSEVIAYDDAEDLVEKVRYYLAHEDERAEVARAGQARTLRDHTYRRRMEELIEILEPYLEAAR